MLRKLSLLIHIMITFLPCFLWSEATSSTQIELHPNHRSTKSAIEQVQKVFGKYSIESPGLFSGNHQGFEHIQIIKDDQVESAFVFYIHRDLDGDRDKQWPSHKARQRNEIKGYVGSPDILKAQENQSFRYRWYFRIDDGFQITKNFCHFFQLKPAGSDNINNPLLTLSGVVDGGKPQLQVQLWEEDRTERQFLANWKDCLGKWLLCECKIKYANEGNISFSISSLDQSISITRSIKIMKTWQKDFSFVRPKWGIYRSLVMDRKKMNQEDKVFISRLIIDRI